MSPARLVTATATTLGILLTVVVALIADVATGTGPAGANPAPRARPAAALPAAAPRAAAPAATDLPTASPTSATASVGPLFSAGLAGGHSCTASVVASPSKDLALTAAHCLDGTVAGWLFAPGYNAGSTPYGVWTVVHAYLPAEWLADQDPHYDYAILQLADQTHGGRTVGVEDFAGGNVVGLAPETGQQITDIAYNGGRDDLPITCTTTAHVDGGYPAFDCHGYVSGSSGSPWLASIEGTADSSTDYTVRGVIGGLNQGGCYDYRSYSAPFTSAIYHLLFRATFRIHPDTAPAAGSDGC